MGINVIALLEEARRNPLAWVDEVEKRLDSGWLGEPETITAESYKTGKSYTWVKHPISPAEKAINAKILEVIAWWSNNLRDYMSHCIEKERYTHADKATKVMDAYINFLLENCPAPVKHGGKCHSPQRHDDDKFSPELCSLYYRVAQGLDWTITEEPKRRDR